jgi:glycosyltransferase involved in cell wall biosynthesis
MLFNPVEVLFIPAHTVPVIHPRNTVVTIHGLEYEFFPRAYSWWGRNYMRWVIKNSCRWAKKIIAVSNNTKKDLMALYRVPEDKIKVVYEGFDREMQNTNLKMQNGSAKCKISGNYLLFIGRLEERKNIVGIIKAFEVLKDQYKLPHKLVLAGKPGYGWRNMWYEIENSEYYNDIFLPGYVSEESKWRLLGGADVFLFPTFYEGFGIPILEAQSVGCPVVAGDNSSIPEVIGAKVEPSLQRRLNLRRDASAVLVDPNNAGQIADAVYKLIADKNLRSGIIGRGYRNVRRFSWESCTEQISKFIFNGKG